MRDQKLWTRNMEEYRFLGVGGNRSARRKTYQGGYGIGKPNSHTTTALVKGKCSRTKPTRHATGVVCLPDTDQNRPYKNPLLSALLKVFD